VQRLGIDEMIAISESIPSLVGSTIILLPEKKVMRSEHKSAHHDLPETDTTLGYQQHTGIQ